MTIIKRDSYNQYIYLIAYQPQSLEVRRNKHFWRGKINEFGKNDLF